MGSKVSGEEVAEPLARPEFAERPSSQGCVTSKAARTAMDAVAAAAVRTVRRLGGGRLAAAVPGTEVVATLIVVPAPLVTSVCSDTAARWKAAGRDSTFRVS